MYRTVGAWKYAQRSKVVAFWSCHVCVSVDVMHVSMSIDCRFGQITLLEFLTHVSAIYLTQGLPWGNLFLQSIRIPGGVHRAPSFFLISCVVMLCCSGGVFRNIAIIPILCVWLLSGSFSHPILGCMTILSGESSSPRKNVNAITLSFFRKKNLVRRHLILALVSYCR